MGQVPSSRAVCIPGSPTREHWIRAFELLYGRTVCGPMQVLKEHWTGKCSVETKNTYQYVLDLWNRLKETCELVRESLQEAQGRQKHHYDKNTQDCWFKVGQKVLMLLPTNHNKLLLQRKGPFVVPEAVNRMEYKIWKDGNTKIFHANLLKAYLE